MDLLKAELARKKADHESYKEKAQANLESKSRFIKRGDMMRVQEEERLAKLQNMRLEIENKKRQREQSEQDERFKPSLLLAISGSSIEKSNSRTRATKASRLDNHETSPGVSNTATLNSPVPFKSGAKISSKEVKMLLRELGKEITLFGETDDERAKRLAAAQAEEPQDAAEFELGEGHEVRNLFIRKGSMNNKNGMVHEGEDEDDEDKDEGPISDFTYVRRYLKSLLKEWEEDLNARPDHIKGSVQGRRDTRTQKQSKDYLRPLFKLCKHHDLNPGILANLVKIVDFIKEGEFVRAHDVYMLTAIGNAPWPIGLTMVGIHERSGREKIESRNVAHIMNNEAQRKYLVSIKRLMTYIQEKRVDIPPSKKVL